MQMGWGPFLKVRTAGLADTESGRQRRDEHNPQAQCRVCGEMIQAESKLLATAVLMSDNHRVLAGSNGLVWNKRDAISLFEMLNVGRGAKFHCGLRSAGLSSSHQPHLEGSFQSHV